MTRALKAAPGLPILRGRETALVIILVLEMIVLAALSDEFLTARSLLSTSRFFVEAGLIALGMTLIILIGGIDLSVGSALALVSVVLGFSWAAGVPLLLAVLLSVAVSVALGAVNGYVTVWARVHPLAVTLGTFTLYRGLAFAISGADAVSGYPSWFGVFGQFSLGPVPLQLIVFVAAAALMWWIVEHTNFGRYVLAIGNNETAARFAGVPVARIKVMAYTITGFLVGLAALIYTSRVATARANAGIGLELTVIAAVVLGGASIYGGSGTIAGTVLGVLILSTLQTGLLFAGVSSASVQVVLGIALLTAVGFNEWTRRRK